MILLLHQIILHAPERIFQKGYKIAIDDKTNNEKQYDINREGAKISALSSGKINKYEYLTGEKILPSDQSRIIKQVKFTYQFRKSGARKN